MKRFLFVSVAFFLIAVTGVRAQDYRWAFGLRGGVTASGVTAKYNFDPANSIEGMFDFVRGLNAFLLYERHVPVIGQGFRFFYGAGLNIGDWKRSGEWKVSAGINLVTGLEYKIPSLPLAFSIDYKPCYNFAGHTRFFPLDFGIGIKAAF